MSSSFQDLLEATIRHLEDLRAHGARFVPVQPATWAALGQPVMRQAATPPANPSPAAKSPPPTRSATLPATPSLAPVLPSSGLVVAERAPVTPSILPPRVPLPSTQSGPTAQPGLGLGRGDSKPSAPAEKEAALAALRSRVLPCRKCEHLASSRRTVVFGVGSANADLMFVGEAPGADEDARGEPFVGRAGETLTKIIQTMGLSRETVYIANVLKCRPDTPGQSMGNRKPTPSEMVTCLPYLLEQIEIIQPKVLVALGATAVEGLMGRTEGITRIRGRWLELKGIPLMPTFHPAYLLHKEKLGDALGDKRKVWEDMLQVMERLGLPITEKQRGYFLRG